VALDNRGTVQIDAATTLTHSLLTHTNSGTINVSLDDLTLTGTQPVRGPIPSFTNTGAITLASGRHLFVIAAPFIHQAGATLSGPNAGLVFTNGSGQLNGTVTLASLSLNNSSLVLGTDLNTAQTALSVVTSNISGSGTITNAVGRTLTITNSSLGTLTNQGTLIFNGTGTFTGPLSTTAGSVLRLQGDASTGTALLNVIQSFTNNGAIELTSAGGAYPARLDLGTQTLTNGASGSIATLVGGGGTRTIAANVVNSGSITVAPTGAGTLALLGSLTTSGTINLELGGTAAAQSDFISMSGSLLLSGGTLNVTLINGFNPASGNVFPLITASNITGDFTSYNLPGGAASWTKASPPVRPTLLITKN
jgi:hypothetical protein